MRTPWKMLADLVSGKSSKDETETELQTRADEAMPAATDAHETTASADAAPAAIENDVATSSEPAIVIEPEALESTATVNDAETLTTATRVSQQRTAEQDVDVVTPSATIGRSIQPQTRRRATKAPAAAKAKRVVITRQNAEIAPPAVALAQVAKTAPKSHSDEMTDLDQDIEALRKQLAEKLKLQNAQLRKLLDRYEGR